ATVPEDYFLGDKALYLAAVRANKPVYSRTGVIPAAGMTSAADMLLAFDDELKGANVDLAKTFDGRFVAKAAAGEEGPNSLGARPFPLVPARGTPRRSRRGDPVAGTQGRRSGVGVPGLASLARDTKSWIPAGVNPRESGGGNDRSLLPARRCSCDPRHPSFRRPLP